MLHKSTFYILITPPISSLLPLGRRQYTILLALCEKQYSVCYLASLELLSVKQLSCSVQETLKSISYSIMGFTFCLQL